VVTVPVAVTVRALSVADEELLREAAGLFDHPLDPAAARAFLADERHHLLVAYVEDSPAGFVSAVELLHPDKPRPEMLLYELGVADAFRRRGVGTALMAALVEVCHRRGCGELFVLTEPSNEAAKGLYAKVGGTREPDAVMFTWDWRDVAST
jgi:ribosomal protein S18 acetylase RimI-like enzyme